MNQSQEQIDKAILAEKIINEKVTNALKGTNASRRWFWELLQNAKDTVVYDPNKPFHQLYNNPERRVSVNLYYYKNIEDNHHIIYFEHSGNPFRDNIDPLRFDDVKNLILPVSGKTSQGVTTGKFGTGFLSTHIMSLKVKVSGVFEKLNGEFKQFNISIDRTQTEREKRIQSIAESLNQYANSFQPIKNYKPDINNFQTARFIYDLFFNPKGESYGMQMAEEGIKEIFELLPFVLAFVPEIDTVKIFDYIKNQNISEFKTIRNSTKNNGIDTVQVIRKDYHIDYAVSTHIGKEKSSSLVQFDKLGNEDVEITIPKIQNTHQCALVDYQEQYKQVTGNEFPSLFSSFPLIGSEDFKFPVVVNSQKFMPRETRDGIHLLNDEDGNQTLIESAAKLYFQLLKHYSEIPDLKNLYVLAKTKHQLQKNHNWINYSWYVKNDLGTLSLIEKIRAKILVTPLVNVKTKEGKIKRPSIKNEENKNNISFPINKFRTLIHKFSQELYPTQVPILEETEQWNSVLWDEKSFIRINTRVLVRAISKFGSVPKLANHLFEDENQIGDALNWLVGVFSFINNDVKDFTLYNYQENSESYPILPNRNLNFSLGTQLHKDIGFNNGIINNDLLKIHFKFIGKDYKENLLHHSLKSLFNFNTTPITSKKIADEIKPVVGEILRKEFISPDDKNNLSDLYEWVKNNKPMSGELFQGLRLEKILYELVPQEKSSFITKMLEIDRKGIMSLDRQSEILSDPNLEKKLELGERALREALEQELEFQAKKKIGDLFERIFEAAVLANPNLKEFKPLPSEGDEDYILVNQSNGQRFFIELKSIKKGKDSILMYSRQAKKAVEKLDNYFLCVVENTMDINIDKEEITEEEIKIFKTNAVFNNRIGANLQKRFQSENQFFESDDKFEIEMQEGYKVRVKRPAWGDMRFGNFVSELLQSKNVI